MGETQDLGRRIELFSMDANCLDISLALYRRGTGESARVLVHSYSQLDGVTERVGFISQALQVKAGLEPVSGESGWLKFPCDGFHQRALTRAFLDVCKLASGTPLAVEPLSKFDKKADCNLSAVELGGGVYEMRPDQQTEAGHKRASALTRGFVKLCQMEAIEGPSGSRRVFLQDKSQRADGHADVPSAEFASRHARTGIDGVPRSLGRTEPTIVTRCNPYGVSKWSRTVPMCRP